MRVASWGQPILLRGEIKGVPLCLLLVQVAWDAWKAITPEANLPLLPDTPGPNPPSQSTAWCYLLNTHVPFCVQHWVRLLHRCHFLITIMTVFQPWLFLFTDTFG